MCKFQPATSTDNDTIIVEGIIHVLDTITQKRYIVRVMPDNTVRVEEIRGLGKAKLGVAEAKKKGLLPK